MRESEHFLSFIKKQFILIMSVFFVIIIMLVKILKLDINDAYMYYIM